MEQKILQKFQTHESDPQTAATRTQSTVKRLKVKGTAQNGAQSRLDTCKVPIGPIVVPFWGSYVESYKVIPKRNYYGAYG